MKRLPILALLIFSTLFARAAQPTGNIPISAMPEATNALDTAYVPIIQPYPGRTTNDNFKVSVASLFDARPQAIITNLTVYNFTVISNFFSTTTNITAYEITVTNNISHDRIFISTNITINGFDINTWTNDNAIFHPTINRGAGPLDYSFLVASNIVRVEDGRMSGTETWVSKSVALNIGDNQLPVAGNSQWNLIAATSNPDDTTISLMNGITDAQKLVIYNITNAVPANGAFKLTNGTPIPDSLSGGIARLMGGRDWVATNGSWIMLEFHSPDWVEMDDRNVFTGAGGADTWHVVNGILQPVNLALPVEIDSSLVLGPSTGGTNVIYRTNNYAFVFQSTDVANRSQLWFTDEAGDTPVNVGMVGTGTALLEGSLEVQIEAGANGIVMDANHGRPVNTLPFSWGDQELPFTNIWGGVLYVEGYQLTGTITNTINYSRGALYHTGTNGFFNIESQADGIAGSPVPIYFNIGPTNIARIVRLNTQGRITVLSPDQATTLDLSADNTATGGVGSSGVLTLYGSGFNVTLQNGSMQPTYTMDLGTASFPWHALVLAGITKAQKTALTPVDGMLVYQTDNTPGLRAYVNGAWVILQTAADP